MEKILFKAITAETPDIETLEKCLNGTLKGVIFYYDKADVNTEYQFHEKLKTTMLNLAVRYGKSEVIKFLLRRNDIAPFRPVVSDGNMNALQVAIMCNQTSCIGLLMDAAPNKLALINEFSSRKEGNRVIVQSIVHFASKYANDTTLATIIEIVRNIKIQKEELKGENYLIDKDIVSLKDADGYTPLHIAASSGNTLGIVELIRRCTDIDAVNVDGNTALHLAVIVENVEVITLLQDNMANGSIINNRNQTPESIARGKYSEAKRKNETNISKFELLVDCTMRTSFFGLPVKENDCINYVKEKVKRDFYEEIRKPGGLSRALFKINATLQSHLEDKMVRIAVIGEGDAGKSSTINALIGRDDAPVGVKNDTTKYPCQYVVGNKIFIDFPGFATMKYGYKEFEKFFNWSAYDIVIVVNRGKIHRELAYCISKAIQQNMANKVIYVQTYLESLIINSFNNANRLRTRKNEVTENIKQSVNECIEKIIEEQYYEQAGDRYVIVPQEYKNREMTKYIDATRLEEEKNMFFVSTPEDHSKNIGIEKLIQHLNILTTPETILTLRKQRNSEIFEELVAEYENRYKECRELIRTQINWSITSLAAKVGIPAIIAIACPYALAGFASGVALTYAYDYGTKKFLGRKDDHNQDIEEKLRIDKLGSPKQSHNNEDGSVLKTMGQNLLNEGEGACVGFGKLQQLMNYCSKNPGQCSVALIKPGVTQLIEKLGLALSGVVVGVQEYIIYKKTKDKVLATEEKAKEIFKKRYDAQEIHEEDIQYLKGLFTIVDDNDSKRNTFLMILIDNNSNSKTYMKNISSIFELMDPIDLSVKNSDSKTLFMFAVKNRDLLYGLLTRNLTMEGEYSENPKRYLENLSQKDTEGKNVLMHAIVAKNLNSLYFTLACLNRIKSLYFKDDVSFDNNVEVLINSRDNLGRNLLMLAIESDENIAKYLLGINVPELFETESDHNITIQCTNNLIQRDPQNTNKYMKTIQQTQDEIKAIIEVVKNNYITNNVQNLIRTTDLQGNTAIHYALSVGSVNLINEILRLGGQMNVSRINIKDNSGKTMFMRAVEIGSVEMVGVLVKNKADIRLLDNNNKSFVSYLNEKNYKIMLPVLLNLGINVDFGELRNGLVVNNKINTAYLEILLNTNNMVYEQENANVFLNILNNEEKNKTANEIIVQELRNAFEQKNAEKFENIVMQFGNYLVFKAIRSKNVLLLKEFESMGILNSFSQSVSILTGETIISSAIKSQDPDFLRAVLSFNMDFSVRGLDNDDIKKIVNENKKIQDVLQSNLKCRDIFRENALPLNL